MQSWPGGTKQSQNSLADFGVMLCRGLEAQRFLGPSMICHPPPGPFELHVHLTRFIAERASTRKHLSYRSAVKFANVSTSLSKPVKSQASKPQAPNLRLTLHSKPGAPNPGPSGPQHHSNKLSHPKCWAPYRMDFSRHPSRGVSITRYEHAPH